MGEPVSRAPIRGATARIHVATEIRNALRVGDLVPGQRLVEQDLADQYGVTRTSAREALFDLAADDVVELVPHRGARVRVVSVEEAVQITECRAALERLCARRAAEHASRQQREELAEVGAQLRTAVADGALETYSALNRRLHDLIIEFSGQAVAKRQLERLNVQMVRFQFRLALRPGRSQESLPQLLAIVDAVTAGDPDAADAAVAAQLADVTEQLRATKDLPGRASRGFPRTAPAAVQPRPDHGGPPHEKGGPDSHGDLAHGKPLAVSDGLGLLGGPLAGRAWRVIDRGEKPRSGAGLRGETNPARGHGGADPARKSRSSGAGRGRRGARRRG